MNKKIFAETKAKAIALLNSRRIRDAINMALSMAIATGNHPVKSRLEKVEESYRLLLDYTTRGADDPSRAQMISSFTASIHEALDMLERDMESAESPNIYFSTLRYENLQQADTLSSLLSAYDEALADSSLFNIAMSGAHSERLSQSLSHREQLERRLFNRVWVTHPFNATDAEALRGMMASERIPSHFKEQMVWALMLGGLQYHSETRLDILLDSYGSADRRVSAASMIALLLLLHSSRQRPISKPLSDKFHAVTENPQWLGDLREVYMRLVKTIDTDRIVKTFNDGMIEELRKIHSKIDTKFNSPTATFDPAEIEENPEWQELLKNSGIGDKLKELSEIQEEGGDIMIGAFGHLKQFPFFNDTANWFMPFRPELSSFTGNSAHDLQELALMTANQPMLCDSDKYSFIFAIENMPAQQRQMMIAQLQAQADQMMQMQAASLTHQLEAEAKPFAPLIQNLYRFYKLFRRKGDFPNPFAAGINLAEVPVLQPDIQQLDILPAIAEYYFSHGYYPEALEVYNLLEADSEPEASRYQKMAYALQQTSRLPQAIELYRKAEMLDNKSNWTLRQLARCLMAEGRYNEALERWNTLRDREPKKISNMLNAGRCLVESGRFEEATSQYYQAEFADEHSPKPWRPLAWCLMLTGKTDRARGYYEKIIAETTPTDADYLNMGHLSAIEHRMNEAMNFYSLSLTARAQADTPDGERPQIKPKHIESFIADMQADGKTFEKAGIDASMLPLLTDALLYKI